MRELIKLFMSCAVLGLVFSQSHDYSEELIPEFNSLEELTQCIAQGTCPREVELPGVVGDSLVQEPTTFGDTSMPHELSYSKICQKITSKLHELEVQNPELKAKKMELLQKITKYASAFDPQSEEGESIILKILNFVVLIAEKLKVEFLKKLQKKIPQPVSKVEIFPEFEHPYPLVGSVRGVPGEHYPNYTEVPITPFSCNDKKYIPGFYADLDTGCQVFHVCYEHRMESFLCPVGTIFNQPILACDYWYSSNCSQAPIYYDVNVKEDHKVVISKEEKILNDIITTVIDKKPMAKLPKGDFQDLLKFLPIKAKVTEFSKKPQVVPLRKVVKPKAALKFIPKPFPVVKPFPVPKLLMKPGTKSLVHATKAKIPVVKSKLFALPLAKTKLSAATVPMAKVATKALPLMKMTAMKPKILMAPAIKFSSAPLLKSKGILISPMTKKALALGYKKLLKAKKMAMFG